jgi:ankyrin repeat protein
MMASYYGHAAIVKLLLEARAKADAKIGVSEKREREPYTHIHLWLIVSLERRHNVDSLSIVVAEASACGANSKKYSLFLVLMYLIFYLKELRESKMLRVRSSISKNCQNH